MSGDLVHKKDCVAEREWTTPIRDCWPEDMPVDYTEYSVTQIVGIVLKDGCIAIGSESQFTYIGGGRQHNKQKVFILTFKDGNECLIAFCGVVKPAQEAIARLQILARNNLLEKPTGVVKLIKQAMNEYRQKSIATNKLKKADQDTFFGDEKQYFAFMVGFYWKRTPYLFTIGVQWMKHTWHKRYAIGCESRIANGFLDKFFSAATEQKWMFAIPLMIETLEYVKDKNAFCGGPLAIGIIDSWIGNRNIPKARIAFGHIEHGRKWLEPYVTKLKTLRDAGIFLTPELLKEMDDAITLENNAELDEIEANQADQ